MVETITEGRPVGVSPQRTAAPPSTQRLSMSWARLGGFGGAVLAVLLLGAALGMSLQRGVGALPQPDGGSVDIGSLGMGGGPGSPAGGTSPSPGGPIPGGGGGSGGVSGTSAAGGGLSGVPDGTAGNPSGGVWPGG